MRTLHALGRVAVAVALAGCVSTRDESLQSAGGADSSAGGSGGDGAASMDGGGGPGGPKLDVGGGSATHDGGDNTKGCEKIDFLFVIDHSASMGANQENLATSFPGFISTIEDVAKVSDYHIMVVDTDEWGPALGRGDFNQQGSNFKPGINCSPAPQCCDPAGANCQASPSLPCNGTVCRLPDDACDYALGGAWDKRYPTLERCPIDGDRRYIQAGQSDLLATFECMAGIGTWGDGDELAMGAMAAALSPTLLGAGGCNEGFVRDDALLVITFITDAVPASAWEQNTPDPAGWYSAVLQAKNGVPEAVVALGLIGDTSVGLREFIALFGDHGFQGSVESPDYTPFFVDAVEAAGGIDDACQEFEPVG